jgi:TPR repeat protein
VALMERGEELLKNGDVSSAQLAFRRVADAGRADAALALATTYDPRYLAEHKILVIVGDETQARTWYQRAKELGSTEAERILQQEYLK